MTGLLSPTLIQLLHKFKVCASKAVFKIVCCSWGLVLKREDGKRIKGEHGKPKGEKTKITPADKQKGTSIMLATQSSK
jgi:hypothetical protein